MLAIIERRQEQKNRINRLLGQEEGQANSEASIFVPGRSQSSTN